MDSNAFLHCSVINMDEDTQVSISFVCDHQVRTDNSDEQSIERSVTFSQVSWIRRRDWHIMSVGETVFTTDDRVQVLFQLGSTRVHNQKIYSKSWMICMLKWLVTLYIYYIILKQGRNLTEKQKVLTYSKGQKPPEWGLGEGFVFLAPQVL